MPFVGKLFASDYPLGASMLTAGIVLAIMVIPFISSVMREVFQTVPTRLKESAYALGSSTWEVVWDIVLPYTRSAVIGGIFLGLGRALGETMAVTFVLGNAHDLSASLLDPGTSIASTIANEFSEAVRPAAIRADGARLPAVRGHLHRVADRATDAAAAGQQGGR